MGACDAVEKGNRLKCQGMGWGVGRGEGGGGRKGGLSGALCGVGGIRVVGVVGVVGVWTRMNRLERGRRYGIDVHSGDGWGGGRVGWGVRVGGVGVGSRGKAGCAVEVRSLSWKGQNDEGVQTLAYIVPGHPRRRRYLSQAPSLGDCHAACEVEGMPWCEEVMRPLG
jgi:hypothetical protein